ncbi:MAG: hypothetical protein ACP5D2_00685 [Candidatus Nanoarchaeia archaeon]
MVNGVSTFLELSRQDKVEKEIRNFVKKHFSLQYFPGLSIIPGLVREDLNATFQFGDWDVFYADEFLRLCTSYNPFNNTSAVPKDTLEKVVIEAPIHFKIGGFDYKGVAHCGPEHFYVNGIRARIKGMPALRSDALDFYPFNNQKLEHKRMVEGVEEDEVMYLCYLNSDNGKAGMHVFYDWRENQTEVCCSRLSRMPDCSTNDDGKNVKMFGEVVNWMQKYMVNNPKHLS